MPRGVSGNEERQEIVENVLRSDSEDRQDAAVYADSLSGKIPMRRLPSLGGESPASFRLAS